MGEREMS